MKATKTTGHSSQKYGPCEVCGAHASDVHLRALHGKRSYVFGHEGCINTLGDNELSEAVKTFMRLHHGVTT